MTKLRFDVLPFIRLATDKNNAFIMAKTIGFKSQDEIKPAKNHTMEIFLQIIYVI